MPAWLIVIIGIFLILLGIFNWSSIALDREDARRSSEGFSTDWRECSMTTWILWTAVGILPGIGLVVYGAGRMFFSW